MKILIIALLFIFFIFLNFEVYGLKLTDYIIETSEDSYVVTDLNDPHDFRGLHQMNFGKKPFLKTWFSWNATESSEKVNTISYLKFDLSNIDPSKIHTVTLEIPIQNISFNSTNTIRAISVYSVDSNDWTETEITYENRPALDEFISNSWIDNTATISKWVITDYVVETAGSEITLAIELSDMYMNMDESVYYYSKNSEDPSLIPYIKVLYYADELDVKTLLPYILTSIIIIIGFSIFLLTKRKYLQQPATSNKSQDKT